MIKAVIFDLDGVIIDSEQLWSKCNVEFLESYGIQVKPEDLYGTIGGSMDFTYRTLFDFFPEGTMTMSRMRYEYDRRYVDMEVPFAELFDHDALELLKRLKEKGITTAIASASSRPYIEDALEKCGISEYVDQIVSGEEVHRNKPDPEVYLVSWKKLGFEKDDCLVVEDSNAGIQAGKSAGIPVCGVKGYGNQNLSLSDYPKKGLLDVDDIVEYDRKKDAIIRLEENGKEILLVPTAHVSKESANFVRQAIEYEHPDSICVELDDDRYKSITEKKKWESTSLKSVIQNHKTGFFLVNLFLSSYQKRLAKNLGSSSGGEMLMGIQASKRLGIPLVLADRSVQTTFQRIWRKMTGKDKISFFSSLLSSMFEEEEITEEDLAKLAQKDELTAALEEVQKTFPQVADVLVKERDQFLAHKIKHAPGNKVLAILGAAHTIGIQDWIHQDYSIDELNEVPPKKGYGKLILWGLSLLLIGLVVFTYRRNPEAGMTQIKNWVLWHGILSALGSAICLAHPLTILVSFLVAPLSSLSPLLAAGWFAGLTQASISKPTVKDFESLAEDTNSIKGFWRNKVTKTLLVVILANLGSSIATLFASVDIVKLFLQVFR